MITELSQRRVFRVVSGYAVVCFVILQIADVVFEPLGIGNNILRVIIAGMLLALPLVAYLAWVFDVAPDSKIQRARGGRAWLEATVAGAALVLLAIGAWFILQEPVSATKPGSPSADEPSTSAMSIPSSIGTSIAVLPFTNLSDDVNQEYFSDGITEDIISGLARNTSLIVRPRSSSFALKGQSIDLQNIGQQLSVTHVLEGSVRRSGERVRVTLQLSEVASNQSIWSDRYEGELADIFTVQDSITSKVVEALKAEFVRRVPHTEFPGTDAYDALLLGRHHFLRLNLAEAKEWLEISTDLDPNNANTWALLARIVVVRMYSGRTPNSEEFQQERNQYINRALAIDPTHPHALGLKSLQAFVDDRDYRGSIETLVKLALDNPNNTQVPVYLSMCLNALGQHSLALKAHARYESLDPIGSQYNQVEQLFYAEEFELARQLFDKYFGNDLEAQARYSHLVFQFALAEGDVATMQRTLDFATMARQPMYSVRKALVQLLQGNQALGQETLQDWTDSAKYKSLYTRSRAALIMGDIETAISLWREGIRTGESGTVFEQGRYAWRRAFPEFYRHPAYQAMLVEFGLDAESISMIPLPEF